MAGRMTRRGFFKSAASLGAALLLAPTQYAQAATNPAGHWGSGELSHAGAMQRAWVDSLGRSIALPAKISSVSPANPMVEPYLRALAPEMMVTTSFRYKREQEKYIGKSANELPVVSVHDTSDDLEMQIFEAIEPDLLISLSRARSKSDAKKIENIQNAISVPVIFMDQGSATPSDTIRSLGELLGREGRADELAEFIDSLYGLVDSCLDSLPGDLEWSVFFAEGEDGLETHGLDTCHEDLADRVGARLAADVKTDEGGRRVSVECVVSWNPDFVVFTDSGCYDSVKSGEGDLAERWSAVPAIEKGAYACAPSALFSWMQAPLLFPQTIGLLWLGHEIYPKYFNYDMAEETIAFYRAMLGYEMDEAEAEKLLSRSARG